MNQDPSAPSPIQQGLRPPVSPAPKRGRPILRGVVRTVAVVFGLFVLAEVAGLVLMNQASGLDEASGLPALSEKDLAKLPARKKDAEKKLAGLAPRGVYIVIDSGLNTLTLRKGGEVLLQAVVSCGSGDVLEEPGGKRSWIFDTPRGEFAVNSKLVDPDWIKPDWAFIEEGEVPPKRFEDRVDSAMLGDYALGFGNGFFIHGTLYTRLLGRNVTHGCVRVGDKDLETVFKTVPIGAKLFIF